ncbi:unnamed protein product [Meloidogyne enterolobii]|uniref:Uncharacterized protein n=1 Tax=Meloidogyne enterolobii TaxID=390850 RepID=A0ACB0YN11_MELEN
MKETFSFFIQRMRKHRFFVGDWENRGRELKELQICFNYLHANQLIFSLDSRGFLAYFVLTVIFIIIIMRLVLTRVADFESG